MLPRAKIDAQREPSACVHSLTQVEEQKNVYSHDMTEGMQRGMEGVRVPATAYDPGFELRKGRGMEKSAKTMNGMDNQRNRSKHRRMRRFFRA